MATMAVSVEEASVWPVVAPSSGEWTVDLLDHRPDDGLEYELLDGILLKFSRYAEAGIPQYWIIDPARPRVEVYDLDDAGEYTLTASAEGDAELTIVGPLAVTVTPTALVAG